MKSIAGLITYERAPEIDVEYIKKPCVVLGVTGGIAVYKACELLRLLQKRGIDVLWS